MSAAHTEVTELKGIMKKITKPFSSPESMKAVNVCCNCLDKHMSRSRLQLLSYIRSISLCNQ